MYAMREAWMILHCEETNYLSTITILRLLNRPQNMDWMIRAIQRRVHFLIMILTGTLIVLYSTTLLFHQPVSILLTSEIFLTPNGRYQPFGKAEAIIYCAMIMDTSRMQLNRQ